MNKSQKQLLKTATLYALGESMSSFDIYDTSSYDCPFCHTTFIGRPTYCPTCKNRLIKKGTSTQFIEGIEEK